MEYASSALSTENNRLKAMVESMKRWLMSIPDDLTRDQYLQDEEKQRMIESIQDWLSNIPVDWLEEEDGSGIVDCQGSLELTEESPDIVSEEFQAEDITRDLREPMSQDLELASAGCMEAPGELINQELEQNIVIMEALEVAGVYSGSTLDSEELINQELEQDMMKTEFEVDIPNPGAASKLTDENPSAIYHCYLCDYSAYDESNLKRHINTEHKGSLYLCDQCNKTYTREIDLKKHKKTHVTESNTFAPSDNSSATKATKAHSLEHKKEINNAGFKTTYPCDQCNYSAFDEGILRRHIFHKHNDSSHPCDQCDKVYSRPGVLRKHKETKHIGILYSKAKTLKNARKQSSNKDCDQCDYTGNCAAKLKQHMESKHWGIIYPCDQCNFVSTTSEYIKRHKKTKHGVPHFSFLC